MCPAVWSIIKLPIYTDGTFKSSELYLYIIIVQCLKHLKHDKPINQRDQRVDCFQF